MSDFAVDVHDVSKRFRLAHGQYNSLKERLIHGGKRQSIEDFWALDDVSFTVRQGETVGILGRNGSGKSTLLKCICGVLQPTSGEVAVRGKLAGLLELGAGFQQDLTGRENIYLNGSLLGMSKSEVDRVFDAIVDFSELEEFIDGQVKFYSSGMYVRLGFAVAVNVDPDVLVIDEVLAVGDERFQRKCHRSGQPVPDGGPHDHARHALPRHGALDLRPGRGAEPRPPGGRGQSPGRRRGSSASASWPRARACRWPSRPSLPTAGDGGGLGLVARRRTGPVRFRSVHRVYSGDTSLPYMRTGDDLIVRVEFEALYPVDDVVFSLEVRDEKGDALMRTDTSIIGVVINAPRGHEHHAFRLVDMPLFDGCSPWPWGSRAAADFSTTGRSTSGRSR